MRTEYSILFSNSGSSSKWISGNTGKVVEIRYMNI